MKAKNIGFSLIELMLTLSVLSLLIGIALPNFNDFIAKRRVNSVQETLIGTLALARSEAVARAEQVSVCGIASGQTNCPASSAEWSAGWDVTVVDSGNLIRHKAQLPPNITITFSSVNPVTFGPLGELVSSANTTQNFLISDSNSSITATLVLRTTGRLRTCQQWDSTLNQCVN